MTPASTPNCNNRLSALLTTIQTLRGKDGCPWDRRQNSHSLLKYLQEECQELIEAIKKDDHVNICEELGDLLYLIVMFSEIGNDQGYFHLGDVLSTINEKLIRRHPHVFADQSYENEEQLAAQWEAIKAEEKRNNSV